MEDIKWLESERMRRPLMEDIKWMESGDRMKRSTSYHAGSCSIDDVADLYLVKSRSDKSDNMSNRSAKSKKSTISRSRSLSRSFSRSRSPSRSLSRSRSVHSEEEDNRSLVHDNISEPVILDRGRVKTMPTTSRGSRNRSQENRPTNFFIWFKQAITSFSELLLLSLPPWDEVATFIQSKNEQLCGTTAATTKSIEDWSDADSKNIKLPPDGDDSTLTNDSASENDRSKKIFSRSNYSGIRTRSKDYSKTPRWSSERCAC